MIWALIAQSAAPFLWCKTFEIFSCYMLCRFYFNLIGATGYDFYFLGP